MPPRPSALTSRSSPVPVVKEAQRHFPGLEVTYRDEDIRIPTDWRIHDRQHSIIVHFAGRMDRLETELEGSGGSTGPALPGEIWTVPAGLRYAGQAKGDRVEYAVLRCNPDPDVSASELLQERFQIAAIAGGRDDFLYHATRQLVQAMQAPDDVSRMMAEVLSQAVLLHVRRSLTPDRVEIDTRVKGGPRLSQHIARELREYVHQRMDMRITLDELAGLAGLGTHQFLIAFREAFGSTPGQYVIKQRLRRARHLLLNSRKDITTIALECGFSSHSHLTARFTKSTGCSPKAFRSRSDAA